MANSGSSGSHPTLSISPPFQISHSARDARGPGNLIPLSPQWLIPKAGENKPGVGSGEFQNNQSLCFGTRQDTVKYSGSGGEDIDYQKKAVFRPSLLEGESGRRDRWRDDERDSLSSVGRDRKRDGEKDLGESWTDRRTVNNPPARSHDGHRSSNERWNDQSHREVNFDQRRESKWNTRWGPEKEADRPRDKWLHSTKDGENPTDKSPGLSSVIGKDEKESDVYRPWRLSSHSRGRGDTAHQQSPPIKQVPTTFPNARGRGDHLSTFSMGRGRSQVAGSSTKIAFPSQTFGTVVDKGDSCPFKYSRARLLFVYRQTDMRSGYELVNGFVQVPSLTQEEPLDPLALCAPNFEEADVLDGIEKGDIVSSGALQQSKEGSVAKSLDHSYIRQSRQDDSGYSPDEVKDENLGNLQSHSGTFSLPHTQENRVLSGPSDSSMGSLGEKDREDHSDFDGLRNDSRGFNRYKDPVNQSLGMNYFPSGPQSKPSSLQDQSLIMPVEMAEVPIEQLKRVTFWNKPVKDGQTLTHTNIPKQSITIDEASWKSNDADAFKRQPGVTPEREELRLPLLPPENLVLYYKDPQGEIQGPFSGADIIGWFETGYFGIDLQVCLANAPHDSPFLSLGDVMPHLRAKARPPPGFTAQKQNDAVESLGRQAYAFQNLPSGMSDVDATIKNFHKPVSSTEAENRFLESLMAGSISSGGRQGFSENFSSPAVESLNDARHASKKMSFDNQQSLTNPYSYWPGRDSTSTVSQPELIGHSKFLSSSSELLQQLPSPIVSDRTVSGGSNAAANWARLQAPLDQHLNKQDVNHLHNLPAQASLLQQMAQIQNPPVLTNVLGPSLDSLSASVATENLLSSGLPQDPQILSILQQQYLLQLHSQALSQQPLSVADKIYLLKQQQKHEEQQQLLRQQQMLSQALADHHSHQVFSEPSYRQLQTAGLGSINQALDPLPTQSSIQIGSHIVSSNSREEQFQSIPQQIIETSSYATNAKLPLNYPLHSEANFVSPTIEQVEESHQRDVVPENLHVKVIQQHDQSTVSQVNSEFSDRLTITRRPELLSSTGSSTENIILKDTQDASNHTYNDTGKYQEEKRPDDPLVDGKTVDNDLSAVLDVKNADVREGKKVSEKRSKKQRSVKSNTSSDNARSISKVTIPNSTSPEGDDNKCFDAKFVTVEDLMDQSQETCFQSGVSVDSHVKGDFDNDYDSSRDRSEFVETEKESKHDGVSQHGQRAWKPAPGFKAKSILEIQLEEQMKAQTDTPIAEIFSSIPSNPWLGMAANSESKQGSLNDTSCDKAGVSPNSKGKKSQLHDLFVKEEMTMQSGAHASEYAPSLLTNSNVVDDGSFIEAKETKKGKKKSGKGKSSGVNPSAPVSVEVPVSTASKNRVTQPTATEKEAVPAIPSGPSLADFVVWKGESNNSAPLAWTNETKKVQKPTSLRDIQKEQEKGARRQPTVQIQSQKQPVSLGGRASGSSWPAASSPSKTSSASLLTSSTNASQSKSRVDDDLFWGPADPSKDAKLSEFPDLASQGSAGSKLAPAKSISTGASGRQKAAGVKPLEHSNAPSHSGKLKKENAAKHSEAMDFRNWCEKECVRLIGTKDTSFLQFCLTQSRSEAELFLIENLGSYDPDHEFIEKFLNYKDLLPAGVLEIAFQNHGEEKARGWNGGDAGEYGEQEEEGPRGGGKKKGRKGKKVSPSVLGFNVVSNRIMMGEIQSVDD